MGLMLKLFDLIFGNDRNVLRDTVEVFHENKEARALRVHSERSAALAQFSSEFLSQERGMFDRLMDAVNRLPRPLMALGCLGLFVSAMVDPVWFASRMQGIALVPEPLWWLLGVVVSFYFGARHQLKGQQFQRSLAASLAMNAQAVEMLAAQNDTELESPDAARSHGAAPNKALQDWHIETAGATKRSVKPN